MRPTRCRREPASATVVSCRPEPRRVQIGRLIEIAEREYAWCVDQLQQVTGELGYGDDWHAALEHVKSLHLEPGEQPQLVRELALEAVEFIRARDLVKQILLKIYKSGIGQRIGDRTLVPNLTRNGQPFADVQFSRSEISVITGEKTGAVEQSSPR